ncbi:MAG TPA: CvpA family protein [Candidatus Limnocylindria bacterium]|nr:CvpA family protein [Candidatus Limnocylindria bacterium]
MIMWIAALVLIVLTTAIGYKQGAIRAAFSFVGLVVAAMLAIPLGPLFAWVFPLIGFKNPLAPKFGGPIIAFFLVSFVFKAAAAFVHRKVEHHFRYDRDDATRAVWEIMYKRVGACVGALNGVVYFFVFALIVAVFGYTTIQTGGAESESKVLSFVSKSAQDLQDTHMDKVVAAFNPAPEKYFDAADVLGLLHQNRNLLERLENYPVFAAMGEEPVYQALGADKELQAMIKSKASFSEILKKPSVQEVLTNSDIVTRVMELDVKDLKEYLETGLSPKFANEKLLGRWGYDVLATLRLNKALRPEVPASTWFRLKNELSERFDGSVLTAFYNEKANFKLAPEMEGRATAYIASPGVRLPNGQIQTNYVPRWFMTNATFSANGKWSGAAPNYLVTLGNRNGTATSEAKLQDSRLSLQFEGKALSFTRLQD